MRISDWSSDVCSSDLLPKYNDCGPFRMSIWATSKNPDWTRRMELTTMPSKSRATALSNAADTFEDPIQRRLSWPPDTEPPTAIFNVGRTEERRVGKEDVSTCRSRG